MYQSIYVPVDNSEHSNRAITTSIALGRVLGSKLVGCHVYAARMHDYRFKQMEFTLPEEYLEENELHRQRKIHDSLITMGLELISDCYLTTMREHCEAAGLEFESKMMDGKHSAELIQDIDETGYDLVVLGGVGIGRTRDTQLGSVCQRVARSVDRDVWVVKHVPGQDEAERDTILVGLDGSPEGFGAMMTGIELAQKLGKKIELVSVYDPYLHYAVFKSIAGVLTDEASKVFRFEEQNQLHEEIIDTGLADIYQSHLNVGETMAREAGVEAHKTLLDGKAFQKILDHARKIDPYLLIIGRVGVHTNDADGSLGGNAESLLRLSPCDVLLTNRRVTPEIDLKAEKSIHWTPEAEGRMVRVPDEVKGIARGAILRLAMEKGHSVVTSDLVTEAMERFMPKASQKATMQLAQAVAYEKVKRQPVSVCRRCNTVALVPDPTLCASCGSESFEVLTPERLDEIAAAEGGTEEETTYDGRKLKWTQDSREVLRSLGDPYQRRRAKARIEKAARGKRLDTVTVELAKRFVEEETGVLYRAAEGDEAMSAADKRRAAEAEAPEPAAAEEPVAPQPAGDDPELTLLARDRKGKPFLSRWTWTEKAVERTLRIPGGFMRDRTQTRIEEIAAERGVDEVDLALVEEGIEHGLEMMKEMVGAYGAGAAKPTPPREAVEAAGAAVARPDPAAAAETCPVEHEGGEPVAASQDGGETKLALNEVGVMSEMEKRRRQLRDEAAK